jgi:hypothetical protein
MRQKSGETFTARFILLGDVRFAGNKLFLHSTTTTMRNRHATYNYFARITLHALREGGQPAEGGVGTILIDITST